MEGLSVKSKKSKIMILFICLVIVVSGLIFIEQKLRSEDKFEFSLEFSVNGEDKISTFDNSFRVHTVEGIKTINLELTEEEKDNIKNFIKDKRIIKENGFVGNKSSKGLDISLHRERCTFTYVLNDKENTIRWTSGSIGPFEYDFNEGKSITLKGNENNLKKVKNLFELRDFIEHIIYEHEETKDLPEHIMYI